MPLLNSISGMRGTIGGQPGENLTPIDIVQMTSAYAKWLCANHTNPSVVIGRDGRVTGPLVQSLVVTTLLMSGVDIIDAGLSTTPTIEMAVPYHQASGGIILTASHNPMNWNALKLLNADGEFLSAEEGEKLNQIIKARSYEYATIDKMGVYKKSDDLLDYHIDQILKLDTVNAEAIATANFSVVVDPVNSTGSFSIAKLLDRLKVKHHTINGEINGKFNHNPEPLAKHLEELSATVIERKADIGIAVDPDVDRLALMCEDGVLFGEEYTLVAVADYLLSKRKGPTVSNLSSSRALADLAKRYDVPYYAAAVGEVNVVKKMKAVNALIGGEGNGGIIIPELHYGRDALVGIALFLSYMAEKQEKLSVIKMSLPLYYMSKQKVELKPTINPAEAIEKMKVKYTMENCTVIDGLKIDFAEEWVHMRKSNTEPIVRIYTEAKNQTAADKLASRFVNEIKDLFK